MRRPKKIKNKNSSKLSFESRRPFFLGHSIFTLFKFQKVSSIFCVLLYVLLKTGPDSVKVQEDDLIRIRAVLLAEWDSASAFCTATRQPRKVLHTEPESNEELKRALTNANG